MSLPEGKRIPIIAVCKEIINRVCKIAGCARRMQVAEITDGWNEGGGTLQDIVFGRTMSIDTVLSIIRRVMVHGSLLLCEMYL